MSNTAAAAFLIVSMIILFVISKITERWRESPIRYGYTYFYVIAVIVFFLLGSGSLYIFSDSLGRIKTVAKPTGTLKLEYTEGSIGRSSTSPGYSITGKVKYFVDGVETISSKPVKLTAGFSFNEREVEYEGRYTLESIGEKEFIVFYKKDNPTDVVRWESPNMSNFYWGIIALIICLFFSRKAWVSYRETKVIGDSL
jgi:hypothetical protein